MENRDWCIRFTDGMVLLAESKMLIKRMLEDFHRPCDDIKIKVPKLNLDFRKDLQDCRNWYGL